jgi:nucleoid-associated protein YgaU
MKNAKTLLIVSAFAIPAGLIWYESKSPAQLATTVLIPVPVLVRPAVAPATPAALPQRVVIESSPAAQAPDRVGADGAITHVVQPGETVSSLAADLDGKNSKTNRDSIIRANLSLQSDPDRLLAGKAYRVPATDAPAAVVAPVVTAPAPVEDAVVSPAAPVDHASSTKDLKYTATEGDTVSKLAGAFLGNDDQAHQNKIINANPSLQADPDKLLAAKTYNIPVPNGLSATQNPSPGNVAVRPTTQPDEDQIISANSPRLLRYTAVAGDSVSTLAIKLLGSDTQAARDTIINSNPSLKQNPDRLIAGQTYSIPAPTAASASAH